MVGIEKHSDIFKQGSDTPFERAVDDAGYAILLGAMTDLLADPDLRAMTMRTLLSQGEALLWGALLSKPTSPVQDLMSKHELVEAQASMAVIIAPRRLLGRLGLDTQPSGEQS